MKNLLRTASLSSALTLGLMPALAPAPQSAGNSTPLTVRLGAIERLMTGVSATPTKLIFEGVNLHVRNGAGVTSIRNGHGNVVLGYDEDGVGTGSHNLVAGISHEYRSYGAVIVGRDHISDDAHSVLLGGVSNRALAYDSTVIGGYNNTASGSVTTVIGGSENDASGDWSSIFGGWQGNAEGPFSTVLGGHSGHALGTRAVASGGLWVRAPGSDSVAFGGEATVADGLASVAAGGFNNTARGLRSVTLGGNSNLAEGQDCVAVGGAFHLVSGIENVCIGGEGHTLNGSENVIVGGYIHETGTAAEVATIVGGMANAAFGRASCVSGGLGRDANQARDWVAGSLFQEQ